MLLLQVKQENCLRKLTDGRQEPNDGENWTSWMNKKKLKKTVTERQVKYQDANTTYYTTHDTHAAFHSFI